VQNFFPRVKPFIEMYIFCNKQLASLAIKICVNCNFNDNKVICYIKTQLKYPLKVSQSYLTEVLNTKIFFLESPHLMGFLKVSQMLLQNCEQKKLYTFKNTATDHFSYFLMP